MSRDVDIFDVNLRRAFGDKWMLCETCRKKTCPKRFGTYKGVDGSVTGHITGCWHWQPCAMPQLSLDLI